MKPYIRLTIDELVSAFSRWGSEMQTTPGEFNWSAWTQDNYGSDCAKHLLRLIVSGRDNVPCKA